MHARLPVLVVATLLSGSLSALAQEARTADEEHEEEVAQREAAARRNDERAVEMYGTADLQELRVRAARHRLREIDAEWADRAGRRALGLVDPLATAATWSFLGPTYRSHRLTDVKSDDSGLVASIALHPTDPKVIFIATAGAGVWRTTDTGTTWKLVTADVGVLQVGAVAISTSDPNRVYAGTACADTSTFQLGNTRNLGTIRPGVGLLASTDGGTTWRVVTPDPSQGPANYYWQIQVDPANPDILLVAGDKGVQRSTDGGVTFTPVLLGENTPWSTGFSRAGDAIYATTWGPNLPGGVFRSTDGGATWTDRSSGLPGNSETRGRVTVAASASDPNRVYVLCDGYRAQVDAARSNDGGATWTALNLSVDILKTQGTFCNVLSVSPTNPDVIHAGGTDHFRSTDGGATWTIVSDWTGVNRAYLHADQHVHAWRPDGSGLYIGNDGGIFWSVDGTAFTAINRGLESYLVSSLCHDPRNLDRIAFGAQDNGSTIRVTGTEYRETTTGDGFACSFHPTNDQVVNASVQNQAMFLSTDGGATFRGSRTGLTDAGTSNAWFGTRLYRSSTEPDRLFTASKKKVWTSGDSGLTWSQVSEQMPHIDSMSDFWVSPKDPKIMALVDLAGRVVISTDGGVSWTHTGNGANRNRSAVRVDTGNASRVFVASSDPTRDRQRLFLSTDGGVTFTPVSNTGGEGGLPDFPIQTLEQDLANPSVWWAGSFIGLYRSGDGGQTWARYGSGLPNVPVTTIALTADGSRLRVGTLGRGVWEIAGNATATTPGPNGNPTPLTAPVGAFSTAPAAPRPGRRAQFVDESTGAPAAWAWDFGDGEKSKEQNPYHVFAAVGTYNVSLTVSNASGTAAAVVKAVKVAYPDTGTGDALTYLVPVLVRSEGAGGTSFGTELTLTNRAGTDLSLTFRLKTTVGLDLSGPYTLKAGQEIHADVFAFLKARGLAIPDGTVVGTFRIEVRGAQNLSQFGAQVRVTTPPNDTLRGQGIAGRFGLSFPALPLGSGATREAVLYGLQQTTATRSNLACVNAGPSGDIALEVSYKDGATGLTHASKDTFNLGPFQFEQKGTPLAPRNLQNAVATIKRTSGTAQFVCYGVLNDNVNGDGSFVPMVITDPASTAVESVVPVIVGTDVFRSELTIANRGHVKVLGQFGVVLTGGGLPMFGDFDVEAGHQLIIPDVVATLRTNGFQLPASTVATMYFEFEPEPETDAQESAELIPMSQVYVGVRTYAQKAGGLFGLAYGYSPVGDAADTEAYVYGLQQTGSKGQDGGTRSNLAVIHAYGAHEDPLGLEVTYYGPDGKELGKEAAFTLQPGEFRQFNAPLERYGVPNGFARIRKTSGSDQFLAYGVLNDQANDDGSYVPMSVP